MSVYDEIKYLVSLCDYVNDEIVEEILSFFDYRPSGCPLLKLSSNCISFIQKNLSVNPVAIMQILSKLSNSEYYDENQNKELMQNVIIDELIVMSESLIDDSISNKKHIVNCSLSVIAEWNFQNYDEKTIQKIVSKIYSIKLGGHGKELYLSILGQDKQNMITALSDHEKKNPSPIVWPLNPNVMVEMCFGFDEHWLLKIVEYFTRLLENGNNMPLYSDQVTQKIWHLALIRFMNSPNKTPVVALERLNRFFSFIDYQNCESSLFIYFNEICRELNLFSFCANNCKKKYSFGWFDLMKNHSALSVISKMCDLSQLDRFKVKQVLSINTELLMKIKGYKEKLEHCKQWDIMAYNAYCIITSIIDVIILSTQPPDTKTNISLTLEEIKLMISNLQPLRFRIEILKNIFACLFLRYEYFSKEDSKNKTKLSSHSDCSYFMQNKNKKSQLLAYHQGFICKSQLVKDVLYMLKGCITKLHETFEMHTKRDVNELENVDLEDFNLLENYVSHAIWKWQIMTNLNVENWDSISTPSLHNSLIDLSSDEEPYISTMRRKKTKLKKRRSKSYNENLFILSRKTKTLNVKKENKFKEPDFMSLMLCSPDTMIALSLETNDFPKAFKIIEIFDLTDNEICSEISFTEQFSAITLQIRKCASNPSQWSTNSSTVILNDIENFLSKNKPPYNYQLSDLVQAFPQLHVYENCNSGIITLIDILISTGVNRDITLGLLNIAENKCLDVNCDINIDSKQNNFVSFLKNIISVAYNIYQSSSTAKSICDIISDDKLPFKNKDYTNFKRNQEEITKFYLGFQNSDYLSKAACESFADTILKQRKLFLNSTADYEYSSGCTQFPESDVCYLKLFFKYIMSVSELINLNDSNDNEIDKDVNFGVLILQIHEIIGNLIQNHDTPIETIEPLCKKLSINMIHKIVLNYCHPIKCSSNHNASGDDCFNDLIEIINGSTEEISIEANENNFIFNKPSQDIINYVLVHNWVIANLLKKIGNDSYNDDSLQQSFTASSRTQYLDTYLQESKFEILKELFNGNKFIAALQTHYDIEKIRDYLKKLLVNGKLEGCLELIDTLPESLTSMGCFSYLKDQILLKLSSRDNDSYNWKYFLLIENQQLCVNHIFEYLKYWTYEGAIDVLQYFLNKRSGMTPACKKECIKWLKSIPVYENISKILLIPSWSEVYSTSIDDPEIILQSLLDDQEFEMCLQWTSLHTVSENVKNLVKTSLIKQVLQSSTNITTSFNLSNLLSEMPTKEVIDLCTEALYKMKDLESMKIVVKFLMSNAQNVTSLENFENTCIGIQFISEMDTSERPYFWELVHNPLLIVEQYLMNAKFDKLTKLLNKIKPFLKMNTSGDNLFYNLSLIHTLTISINAVDALFRIYAAKALDLKSNKHHKASPISKPSDEMFLQSIDSINFVGGILNNFVMPDEAPTKENWTPNNFSNACMVCKTTLFSIIIRRHHCRRCGRLVCYSCSRHRIQIPNLYNDIKVRACTDCYNQTTNKSKGDPHDRSVVQIGGSSIKSETTIMEWNLTNDPKHNDEIRREFVYEFSPNVNLCLSIMKMHSINLDYPRFLLDRGSELSRIAGNTDEGVLELMHMRRALLLSCAVLYARPLPTASISMTEKALAHTEHQLATTDALAHLATHGCHGMMPEVDSLDTHYIRRLLKAEKWELALEISTKFGLSRTGVLAAWGKACLKGGCFDQARQKLALCFKSIPSLNTSSSMNDSMSSSRESLSNRGHNKWLRKSDMNSSSTQFDLYRSKNAPALLDEIVSLIESNSYTMNPLLLKKSETIKTQVSLLKKVKTVEPALNVMHALSRVSKIKSGDFSDFITNHQYVKKPKQPTILKKQIHQNEKYELKQKLEPFFYNECLYYLNNYGSPNAIIVFYLKYGNLTEALNYCLDSTVDEETFTEIIFMKYSKGDKLDNLLKTMHDLKNSWRVWTRYLNHICATLHAKGWLDLLYAVQTGINDNMRAAITCVKLYLRPTQSPHVEALHARGHRLAQAAGHLQSVTKRDSIPDINRPESKPFQMTVDTNSQEKYISTITRQIEIIKYLYTCESSGRLTEKVINEIVQTITDDNKIADNECFLPTLFGTYIQKVQVIVLLLISGESVNEAFDLVMGIIRQFSLDAVKVFNYTIRYLIEKDRYEKMMKLCNLIKKCYQGNSCDVMNRIIEASIVALVKRCDFKGQLFDEVAEVLISQTDDVSLKISCYLECRNVMAAFELAKQSNAHHEFKRIMTKADALGQTDVSRACARRSNFFNS